MSASLDRFVEHYYHRRPVNATFTGIHAYDRLLPDWSPAGLDALNHEMRVIRDALAAEHPLPAASANALLECAQDPNKLDAMLAADFLTIQIAENESGHGPRRNPALWTGEALFSVIALMIRDFAPLEERFAAATSRLHAFPGFLEQARST